MAVTAQRSPPSSTFSLIFSRNVFSGDTLHAQLYNTGTTNTSRPRSTTRPPFLRSKLWLNTIFSVFLFLWLLTIAEYRSMRKFKPNDKSDRHVSLPPFPPLFPRHRLGNFEGGPFPFWPLSAHVVLVLAFLHVVVGLAVFFALFSPQQHTLITCLALTP